MLSVCIHSMRRKGLIDSLQCLCLLIRIYLSMKDNVNRNVLVPNALFIYMHVSNCHTQFSN